MLINWHQKTFIGIIWTKEVLEKMCHSNQLTLINPRRQLTIAIRTWQLTPRDSPLVLHHAEYTVQICAHRLPRELGEIVLICCSKAFYTVISIPWISLPEVFAYQLPRRRLPSTAGAAYERTLLAVEEETVSSTMSSVHSDAAYRTA